MGYGPRGRRERDAERWKEMSSEERSVWYMRRARQGAMIFLIPSLAFAINAVPLDLFTGTLGTVAWLGIGALILCLLYTLGGESERLRRSVYPERPGAASVVLFFFGLGCLFVAVFGWVIVGPLQYLLSVSS